MIHVEPRPEPADFESKVRRRGLAYLRRKKIPLDRLLPAGTDFEPYWRECLDELHAEYRGICAYLAVFIERVIGGASVDHFVAKSKRPDLIYEWSNYRLACSVMNSRKREYEDVLDPFEIENGWFRLEPASGRIYPNPELGDPEKAAVQRTIDRLGLDDSGNREIRARRFYEYCTGGCDSNFLRRYSPFVYFEAVRNGLL